MSITEGKRVDEPASYFIYEQLGQRAVDPETLIGSAMALWDQCAMDYDVPELWDLAKELLDLQEPSPALSWAEHLRVSIIMGSTIPRGWKDSSSFPFKGLLISAIYLQEAERSLTSPIPDRAWHLIAIAYYHLGLNSTESELMAQARKRAEKNAEVTEVARGMVLGALDWVAKNRNPRSIAEAREMVYQRICDKEGEIEEFLFEYADKAKIDKALPNSERRFQALQRIEALTRDWALPNGPYPEISRRFAQFSQRKAGKDRAEPLPKAHHPGEPEGPEPSAAPSLEIISVRADGFTLTTRVSKADPEPDS
ncbi:hypothetical protein [Arenimonas caeni]|uniref:hypothetical protein n=1 Tax=Arenimonas caeni TaxID=2058085 RepID=UPI0013B05E9A|nr:hypothetical protein [Arenimonas caeni]